MAAEEADHRHRRLLRTRHQRPRSSRAAEQRDEFAASSLDHLVGEREQCGRNFEPKRPRGL